MSTESDRIFEFGPFVLDPLEQTLAGHGREIALAPKAFAVLSVLVKNAGRVVTKEEVIREVWPDVIVEDGNLTLNIHAVRKALGDNTEHPTYITTVARRGYRFIAPVTKTTRIAVLPATKRLPVVPDPSAYAMIRIPPAPKSSLRSALAEDGWFLLTSCTLYALLYAIALFVEVAYQFNSYAASAGRVAPLVFLWVWITSMAGLIACRALTLTGRPYSLALSVSLFVAAGVILYVSMGSILPHVPITRALFQTYPAHSAYFKSIIHFFPLVVIFLVVPYHFVVATRTQLRSGRAAQIRELLTGQKLGTAPAGTVFLQVKWLGVILTIAAAASIYATAHLMDNLVSTEYTSIFTQLIQWRLVLYFALGVICLLWYARSLNAIKIASLEMDR
jgi:DNA-binding winged helix-turn-helix (wHTH) protein